MSTFSLSLLDARGGDRFDDVSRFIAADATGSFGVLAGHAPMVAVLRYGLVRFADASGRWRYAALPGGVMRFSDNHLTLATVRYFLGEQRAALVERLAAEMARDDSEVHTARASLAEIERSLVRRLSELSGRVQDGMGL